MDRSQHTKFHSMKVRTRFQPEVWICAYCGNNFTATTEMVRQRDYNERRGKGQSGKFCSRQCNGKVNH